MRERVFLVSVFVWGWRYDLQSVAEELSRLVGGPDRQPLASPEARSLLSGPFVRVKDHGHVLLSISAAGGFRLASTHHTTDADPPPLSLGRLMAQEPSSHMRFS